MLVPLALATYKTDGILLTATAFGLAAATAAQTVNTPGSMTSSTASGADATEVQAMASLVITSNTNRWSRAALGSLFLLGGAVYNYRLQQTQNSDSDAPQQWYGILGEWALTFVLVVLGTLWMASGYHGQ